MICYTHIHHIIVVECALVQLFDLPGFSAQESRLKKLDFTRANKMKIFFFFAKQLHHKTLLSCRIATKITVFVLSVQPHVTSFAGNTGGIAIGDTIEIHYTMNAQQILRNTSI